MADKGYDSSDLRISLLVKDINPQIPSRKNRNYKQPYDKELYKNRSRIERFFARLKQYRGFATRYDKLAQSFLSNTALACAIISISMPLNFRARPEVSPHFLANANCHPRGGALLSKTFRICRSREGALLSKTFRICRSREGALLSKTFRICRSREGGNPGKWLHD